LAWQKTKGFLHTAKNVVFAALKHEVFGVYEIFNFVTAKLKILHASKIFIFRGCKTLKSKGFGVQNFSFANSVLQTEKSKIFPCSDFRRLPNKME
jgi:hypothetical protein